MTRKAHKKRRGWTPLVYHRESLHDSHFPLNTAVLKAFLRELLLLDGTLDIDLTLSSKLCTAVDVDMSTVWVRRCRVHGDETHRFRLCDTDTIEHSKKRHRQDTVLDIAIEALPKESVLPNVVSSAIELVETILKRGIRDTGKECVNDYETVRLPRKVSDSSDSQHGTAASVCVTHGCGLTKLHDQVLGANDVSRFWSQQGSIATDGTPKKTHASIYTELSLRETALDITQRLVQSFSQSTLHLFMGYKANIMQEDRLVHAISNYLFDCSHAVFVVIATGKDEPSLTLEQLYGDRALDKIGGVDDCSLIRSALSIQPLRNDNNWKDFAASASGKRMFQHHSSRLEQMKVGRKRYGSRMRQVVANGEGKLEGCSRASSICSETSDSTSWSYQSYGTMSVHDDPCILHIRIEREMSVSWGVALAKEGKMCVVVKSKSDELLVGDLILEVNGKDDAQATTWLAHSHGDIEQTTGEDWFQAIASLFRSSSKLDLTIQRVGE